MLVILQLSHPAGLQYTAFFLFNRIRGIIIYTSFGGAFLQFAVVTQEESQGNLGKFPGCSHV